MGNDADEDNGDKSRSLVQEEDWIRFDLRSFEHSAQKFGLASKSYDLFGKLYYVLFQEICCNSI